MFLGQMRQWVARRRGVLLAGTVLGYGGAVQAQQYHPPVQHFPTVTSSQPINGQQPVTFQADKVTYDKAHGLIIAEGHVEAWQSDHYLRADKVTFDRNTNIAAAYGHVTMAEPDGQVLFADYAELSEGMRNGVMVAMRAQLDQNAKIAANGGRRVEGKLNIMSKAVYSACDICKQHPEQAPTWQIRANTMTQDLEHQRIEYKDMYLDLWGFPVLYLPYFSNSDPSVKRQSGFLIPSLGATDEYLGSFVRIPYYYVIDGQSDLTATTTFGTLQGPQEEFLYNHFFNAGNLKLDGAIARDEGGVGGFFFGKGVFDWNDTWRYGFDVNLASSVDYMRDFQVPGYGGNILTSNAFIEGFGVGSYSKLDVRTYQGLNSTINQSLLPYVLPRYQYDFTSQPDWFGGRWSVDALAYNLIRDVGTNDDQIAGKIEWDRPFAGKFGDQWLVSVQGAGVIYNANVLNGQPNYQDSDTGRGFHGQAQVAVKLNWPLIRETDHQGYQIIEPVIQVIAAPQSGNSPRRNVPNEDSLDYEFTDATLFSLNRFGGYDRYDGGVRVNFALRGEWDFKGGQKLEGLIGASYIQHITENLYPQLQGYNGFEAGQHLSDIVGRVSYVPNNWVDFTTRARIGHNNGDINFADAITSFGQPILRIKAGYIYSANNPFFEYLDDINNFNIPLTVNVGGYNLNYVTPRQEVSAGFSSHFGAWGISADSRRNLETGQIVSAGGDLKWENNCLILDFNGYRRFTRIAGDHGDTTIILTIILKTLGPIGING